LVKLTPGENPILHSNQGKDAHTGTVRDLLNDPKMVELYLGNLAEL